jgi:hypothetical protein
MGTAGVKLAVLIEARGVDKARDAVGSGFAKSLFETVLSAGDGHGLP